MTDTTMRWFVYPETLPSANDMLRWRGIHARKVASKTHRRPNMFSLMKRDFEEKIALYARLARLPKLSAPVHATLVFFDATKRDCDGSIMAAKLVLDALVRLGVLPDDSPKWVSALAVHVVKGERSGVLTALGDRDLTVAEATALFDKEKRK